MTTATRRTRSVAHAQTVYYNIIIFLIGGVRVLVLCVRGQRIGPVGITLFANDEHAISVV